MELPTWEEVSSKDTNKEPLDPLETFIFYNEPANEAEEWRKELQNLIDFLTPK